MKRAKRPTRRERRAIAFSPPRSADETSTPAGAFVYLGPCVLPEGRDDAEAFLRWIANDVASKSGSDERGALSVSSYAAKLLREFKGCLAENTIHVGHMEDGRWIFIADENRLIHDEVELDHQLDRIARQPTIYVTAEEIASVDALLQAAPIRDVESICADSPARSPVDRPALHKASDKGAKVVAA